jgi:hypothetical protein
VALDVEVASNYNESVAEPYDPEKDTFAKAAREAGHAAFLEALAAGLPVFYIDHEGFNVMEYGDGRRFEIRWLPGRPSGENFEIIRELAKRAA